MFLISVIALGLCTVNDPPVFSPPIPLCDSALEGIKNMAYPSPVIQNIDKDPEPELILGDVLGQLWVCQKQEGGLDQWSAPVNLSGAGIGPQFSNW